MAEMAPRPLRKASEGKSREGLGERQGLRGLTSGVIHLVPGIPVAMVDFLGDPDGPEKLQEFVCNRPP